MRIMELQKLPPTTVVLPSSPLCAVNQPKFLASEFGLVVTTTDTTVQRTAIEL